MIFRGGGPVFRENHRRFRYGWRGCPKTAGARGYRDSLTHTVEIGGIKAKTPTLKAIRTVETSELKCAKPAATAKMLRAIEEARADKDSLGGIIEGMALGVPAGLGEPVFDTLESDLSKALFAIPAVKGVEFGAGFAVSGMKGSENNDPFLIKNKPR